ncbi:hypothetical protein [Alistipes communis]
MKKGLVSFCSFVLVCVLKLCFMRFFVILNVFYSYKYMFIICYPQHFGENFTAAGDKKEYGNKIRSCRGAIDITIRKLGLYVCLSDREGLLPDSAFAEERFVIFDIIIKNLIKKMQCGFVSNGNFHNFVSAS